MKKKILTLLVALVALLCSGLTAVPSSASTENAQTVPLNDTRFWSGTGYGGGGICIENRTEWQTWYDRLSTASNEMSRAADWYSNVGNGIGTCSSRPAQYQIRVYRFSDSAQPCFEISYSRSWSSQGWYYYNDAVDLWLNSGRSSCGISPYNSSYQARTASSALMSVACCDQYYGGTDYSVLNLNRSDIFWPTSNDRNALDRRY